MEMIDENMGLIVLDTVDVGYFQIVYKNRCKGITLPNGEKGKFVLSINEGLLG